MNDIEMRRVILQFAYDHRYERPLRLVSTEDMPFLKAFDIVRVQENIKMLRDMRLVKTENATSTALSITPQGIRLVERPEGLDREFLFNTKFLGKRRRLLTQLRSYWLGIIPTHGINSEKQRCSCTILSRLIT